MPSGALFLRVLHDEAQPSQVLVMTGSPATLHSLDGKLLSAFAGPGLEQMQNETLPQFLPRQRWFGAKDRVIAGVSLTPLGELEEGVHALIAADVRVGDETQRYLMPVSAFWTSQSGDTALSAGAPVLANIQSSSRAGVLIDSALEQSLAKALVEAMRTDKSLEAEGGTLSFLGSEALRQRELLPDPRPLGAEQSNVSIAFGNSVILKLYRRLRPGEQPDVEVARFLSDVGHFSSTPEFLGEIQHQSPSGETTTLAAAFAFVPNEGDAWAAVTRDLTASLTSGSSEDGSWIGAILGQRTAEMHKALSAPTADEDFAVEPLTTDDISRWVNEAVGEAQDLLDRLDEGLSALPAPAQALAQDIMSQREMLISRIKAASNMEPSGGRSRIHGDYHLGQVLVTGRDVVIIDFEGEPKRSLAERRAKSSPLRDVAGMLRSFHYAAWTALDRHAQQNDDVPEPVRARAEAWRQRVSRDYLASYQAHIAGASSYPPSPDFAKALTDLFLLQKAIYEVGYELANRPDWVQIPLSGIRDLLNEG